MKKTLFIIGVGLLIISVTRLYSWKLENNTLIVFGFLLLIAFFEELEEFDFLGLKGKKIDKELKELKNTFNKEQQATNPQQDDLTKLRKKSIQLMGVDRGNFLSLVFEIERLLRMVAYKFFPKEISDSTTPSRITQLLKEKGYLTDNGIQQWNALNQVRNLIIHGRVSVEEDQKLSEWIELAYKLYAEISNDITTNNNQNQNT